MTGLYLMHAALPRMGYCFGPLHQHVGFKPATMRLKRRPAILRIMPILEDTGIPGFSLCIGFDFREQWCVLPRELT